MARFFYSESLKEPETTTLDNGTKVEKIGYTGLLANFSGTCELETIFSQEGYAEKLKVKFTPKGYPPFEEVFSGESFKFADGCLDYRFNGVNKITTIAISF